MSRQYHGRRIYHIEDAGKRAEREEQRFRQRHDRLHRQRLRRPDHPDAVSGDPYADVLDVDDDEDDGGETY